MKLKVYSITLLLSFLIVLSHEMIPHHHDVDDYSFLFGFDFSERHHHAYDTDHHHHGGEHHSHKPEKEHPHSFPFHQHLSVDNGFDYIRINAKEDLNAACISIADLYIIGISTIVPSPDIELIRFRDKPFLIPANFKPGAIGLRAPPAIA